MSQVLRFGIKRSPTVPVLPRDGVLLLESLPLPPAFKVGLDLEGDRLVFKEADPGATNNRDGDNSLDVDRDLPDEL